MKSAEQRQYENLITHMRKNLIDPILGKGYYNHACDTLSCDQFITEDLKYQFDSIRRKSKYKSISLFISLIINICLLFTIVLMLKYRI